MGDKQCIHYWIVDSMNLGRCRYCGAVKDFGALMRREEGKNALKTVSLVESAAAKKRWQDPEYQTRQSAARQSPEYRPRQSTAIKKRWEDPEYQAKQIAARKKRWQEHRAKQSTARIRQHNKIGGNGN